MVSTRYRIARLLLPTIWFRRKASLSNSVWPAASDKAVSIVLFSRRCPPAILAGITYIQSMGKGTVFTGVCLSNGGGACQPGPGQGTPYPVLTPTRTMTGCPLTLSLPFQCPPSQDRDRVCPTMPPHQIPPPHPTPPSVRTHHVQETMWTVCFLHFHVGGVFFVITQSNSF